MLLLKKKRYQEQLLDKTENQISNLERMVSEKRLLCARGESGPVVPAGDRNLPVSPRSFSGVWIVRIQHAMGILQPVVFPVFLSVSGPGY